MTPTLKVRVPVLVHPDGQGQGGQPAVLTPGESKLAIRVAEGGTHIASYELDVPRGGAVSDAWTSNNEVAFAVVERGFGQASRGPAAAQRVAAPIEKVLIDATSAGQATVVIVWADPSGKAQRTTLDVTVS